MRTGMVFSTGSMDYPVNSNIIRTSGSGGLYANYSKIAWPVPGLGLKPPIPGSSVFLGGSAYDWIKDIIA